MAGKPIPGFLCRVFSTETVLLALHDRAPQVNISDDRLSLTGHKFYCTVSRQQGSTKWVRINYDFLFQVRSNLFVNRGTWYFEAKIVDLPEGAATRIGWAQKNANLQVGWMMVFLENSVQCLFTVCKPRITFFSKLRSENAETRFSDILMTLLSWQLSNNKAY